MSCLFKKKTNVGFLHFWGGAKRYIPYISSKIVQSEAQKVHQASRNCFAAASNCSTAWEKQSDWRSHRPLESDCQKQEIRRSAYVWLQILGYPSNCSEKNMALALSGSFPGCPTDPTVFSCQAMKISGYGLFQNVLELISRHCTFQPDHGMSL